jgi:hypothetical protein
VTPVLADVREQLKAYHSEIGRPSVDPEGHAISSTSSQ